MATYKVIGKGETKKFVDDKAYEDSIRYICNPQKASHIGGYGLQNISNAAKEMEDTAIAFHKNKGKRVRHSVLSFDQKENITPEQAYEYGRQISAVTNRYQTVFSVHTNTDHVHIHFVMNQISFVDGQRYYGTKKDYYEVLKGISSVTHLPTIPLK